MAGTAVRGRLTWQVAIVTSVRRETDAVRTIGLEVPDWPGHRAGQPAIDITGGELGDGGVLGPGYDHPVALAAQQRHGVQFDGQVDLGLIDGLAAFRGTDRPRIEPTVPGVEEHGLVPVAARGDERQARTGAEQGGIDRLAGRAIHVAARFAGAVCADVLVGCVTFGARRYGRGWVCY
jgi:hypothetical protein